MIQRNFEPFEDMGPLLGLAQVERRPAQHDFAPVLDEGLEDLLEGQDLRPVLNQRQHDHAERGLHRRVLVQVIEQHEGDLAFLQLDDDPHPVPV